MTPERPTFSPLWHRVRALKPRLRPHVQVTRQHYRGRRWHVVHDPASNQFYRLSPIAHEMVGLLDGHRSVEEVWNISLSTHGDGAPTQGEVIELLGQMYNSNLLAIDTTPETEQLLSRGRERTKRRIASQAIGIMYFRIRLFNPDRYLTWLTPLLKPLINRWGFLAWLAWVAWAMVAISGHTEELAAAFKDAIAPSQWGWVFLVFVVVKAIHETGHGVICKRFGGQVPEFGAMMLVLLPSPYVDASSAWSFPSKWQRMAVGAGGMIFELAVAAGAAHIWLATHEGELLHRLAFNAMFTASVTTLLFNANPLMRFDGYYILSDWLEVPNMMQRSMKALQYLAQKHIYRVRQVRPPSNSPSEMGVLIVYGVLATIYRIFLFFSITLYIMGKLFAIGLLLAIWSAAAWFLIPLGKFIHWLAASPQLEEFRPRAILTSLAILAAGVIGLGAIPVAEHQRASGVVESESRTGVYFGTDGFLAECHVRIGQRVKAGEPIVTCTSPSLEQHLRLVQGQLEEYRTAERQAMRGAPAGAILARQRIEDHEKLVAEIRARIEGLVVRAPHDGVVVQGAKGVDPASYLGAHVRRGQLLCEVVDTERLRIVAALETAQAEPLQALAEDQRSVQVRTISNPGRVLDGRELRILSAGQKQLPHASLGYAGGGTIETEADDREGLAAKSAQFMVYMKADGLAAPGERVSLRFTLPSRPLLHQWTDRFNRMIQGLVDI